MASWRKFRICLVVIVEGILLCRSQPVKASVEVVEMVKDINFFLKYPWGRHSFHRILRTAKVGSYILDTASLVAKLRQSSVAIHGFPLAIQLFAFKYIPLLLKYLPHAGEEFNFLDQVIPRLPKCKSYHSSNILHVEYSRQLFVLPPASGDAAFLASPHCDPKVKQLEGLIASTFNFDKSIWPGGNSSLPSLRSSRKRKCNHCQSDSSSSAEEPDAKKVTRDLRSRSKSKAKRSQTLSQKNVKSLKASLIVEVRELIDKTLHDNTVVSTTVNVTSPVNPASSLPRRVTRSASTAMSVESVANCSTARKKSSVASAKLSASAHTLTESAHNALPSPIRSPSLSTVSSQGCTGFRNCPTGAPPNVPASPVVSGSHAPAVIPSPATYPVSSLCPDNIVFTEKALRCPSLLHEAKKLTLKSSCIPSASDQGPASNHAPEVSNPHCPHPSPYLSTTPGVAPKHNKNLLPNQLSTSSTQLKDVCALNSTAGPSPLSSPVKHLLQSTSRKTMTRSQARIASLPSAKCSQQLLVSGPAMNLRSKKQAPKPLVGDSSEYILSTLEAINSPTVSKFLVKLSKLQGSEYTINGQPYPAAFFSEISKPQNWVSSLVSLIFSTSH
ncbi:uncharacterized protein LOC9310479 [Arabidopsis lyrata subsp. lyrata]|uniref:uncharacterized protein LOC9310479 n=1 Tax=Arabidopsis lyrata subsp. lyrata TaxID=81972 RepID=UPI000A29D2D0|nr:uncharacterized protein LOC9310479 [Arabidopsis lyrata subsp. lyrata]|eukprot:XP_020877112.1 uncharacterized protein LOC9310479 [Arabidopsis lyrata subsp. lyrata]